MSKKRLTIIGTEERAFLNEGVAHFLMRRLEALGFVYEAGEMGSASAGPYATGVFRRRVFVFTLIARFRFNASPTLGCPNYTAGNGFAGHQALIEALGHGGEERLIEDKNLVWRDTNCVGPFEALASDFDQFILPVLADSPSAFGRRLAEAVRLQWKDFGQR